MEITLSVTGAGADGYPSVLDVPSTANTGSCTGDGLSSEMVVISIRISG